MRATATTDAPRDTAADTVAIGLYADRPVAHDLEGAPLQALVDAGEAKATFKHLAHTHAEGKRWVLVGLGPRDELTPERARIAAATVVGRAKELGTRRLCWELPHHAPAAPFVEGTILAAYAFTEFKSSEDDAPVALDELVVSAHDDVGEETRTAAIVATAANAARDLQNTPANAMTPTRLAHRAQALPGVTVDVQGRDGIVALGMGAFAAVAQGTYEEPRLITLRYEHPDATGPVLGLVGKAVTFDAGGISLKPAAKMSEMKFDMSGGAAVLEAVGAIAALGLPVRVVGVIGATENLPSGRSVKPGDVVTARNGLTIEVNNTDAEGRLVLADCLTHALAEGAERLVDVATLTGAIVVALGSTYAGLVADDDAWAARVAAAGEATGELVWRLPLHEEYAEAVRGRYADLDNAPEARKAGSITAGEFLRRFSGDVPWAHVDIAGVAWDQGRPYAAKGGTGVGVRLLVELARAAAITG